MTQPIDSWISEWEILEDLGMGGQGTTHLARRRGEDTRGVIKLLKQNNNQQARKRMRFEVDALKLLSGLGASVPFVLGTNVERADEIGIPLFFVMEYVDGETLHDYVESRKKLNIEESIELVSQIVKTLEIGHEQGIGHRDIKPKNVMVVLESDDFKKVVVLDYGMAVSNIKCDTASLSVLLEHFARRAISESLSGTIVE